MRSKSLTVLLVFAALAIFVTAQEINPDLYQNMRWRLVGPYNSGESMRISPERCISLGRKISPRRPSGLAVWVLATESTTFATSLNRTGLLLGEAMMTCRN